MIPTKLFNCSRKGLYGRLPQTATLGLVVFLFIMIKEAKGGGLELTDPENDKKIIGNMIIDYEIQLNSIIAKKALRLSYIAILISIVAILLQLIQIFL